MIIDACMYHDEPDLLRLRMETLREVVDLHVVIEGAETHAGTRRNPGLLREPSLQGAYDRMAYAVAPLLPPGTDPWVREGAHRDHLLRVLDQLEVPDDATILISDVDEIPDPADVRGGAVGAYSQLLAAYDARNVRTTPWRGTVQADAGTVRRVGPTALRAQREALEALGGGWHYTHMGSLARLQTKIRSYAHQEYNRPEILAALPGRRAGGQDPFGRPDQIYTWRDDAPLPAPLRAHPEAYPMLWRTDDPVEAAPVTPTLRLDMGSGLRPQPGYTSVDLYERADIRAPMHDLPVEAGTVAAIWSSHSLEHVGWPQIPAVLAEWWRVLAPGGELVIRVPDLAWCVRFWLDHPDDTFALATIFGSQEHDGNIHRAGYDQDGWRRVIQGAGFVVDREARMWTHNQETLEYQCHKP